MSILTNLKENSKNIGLVFLFLGVIWGCNDSEFTASTCDSRGDCNVEAQTFSFETSEWSICTRPCGGGTRTRIVSCVNRDNVPVPDDECSGSRPAETESCNTQSCTTEFTWNSGTFSECSRACGGGTAFRNVTCQAQDGTTVPNTNCDPSLQPEVSIACNTEACPEVYTWVPGEPGACSETCGGGTATRSVTCQNAAGNVVADNLCTETRPDTTVACNTQACDFTFSFTTGSFGECSETCGGGTQTRSLGCLRSDGLFVAHTLCPGEPPETTRACNTQACAPTCLQQTISETVPEAQNELDILLVVDDSGSMLPDNMRLAARLSGFINRLETSNIDWQMCVTTTDVGHFQGRPIQWQGTSVGHILRRGAGNLSTIFNDTIRWIGAGFSTDEQGIKAMNLSVRDNPRSNCYRQNAGLSVIVISDEDERSVGGNSSLSSLQFQPLGPLNTPQSFLDTMRNYFPAGKRFVVNSIIVKDNQCRLQQNAQGELSFFGTQYQQLSNLTNGAVESICSTDFAISLDNIYSRTSRTLGTIQLQCTPQETPSIQVNGSTVNNFTVINGNEVLFSPAIPGPATITGSYCCQQ